MTIARVQMLLMELSIFKFKINGPLQLDANQDKFPKIITHAMIIVKVQMLLMEQLMFKLNLKSNIDHKINVQTQFLETQYPAIMKIHQSQIQSLQEKILRLEFQQVEPQNHLLFPTKKQINQLLPLKLEAKKLAKEQRNHSKKVRKLEKLHQNQNHY